ncbi:MarR family winged helix-turn-helix transcriptional regulator [Nocardia grenadensis]|uniref:MarR family winged helix-turn-helix transcriptional regulator n=1 Tax=Nocardia grenadensis TaxID=931537 RepID=UPI001C3FAC87|nr:MarR family winged helix-turn-helix transcriptional regulator [Nocardia grenadensis]
MDDVERVERAMIAIRRRQTRRALAKEGEAAGQSFEVLDVIEATPEPTVSAVASALAVDQPRASKLVAAAVSEGLVRRVADQSDGRRSVLVLTERGRQILERSHARRRAAFDTAMDGWTAGERREFARLLDRFVRAMP